MKKTTMTLAVLVGVVIGLGTAYGQASKKPQTCTQAGEACRYAVGASGNADAQYQRLCAPVVAQCLVTGDYLGRNVQYYGLEKR
jgi:hypothetical protein